jgi:hypothetical protein
MGTKSPVFMISVSLGLFLFSLSNGLGGEGDVHVLSVFTGALALKRSGSLAIIIKRAKDRNAELGNTQVRKSFFSFRFLSRMGEGYGGKSYQYPSRKTNV